MMKAEGRCVRRDVNPNEDGVQPHPPEHPSVTMYSIFGQSGVLECAGSHASALLRGLGQSTPLTTCKTQRGETQMINTGFYLPEYLKQASEEGRRQTGGHGAWGRDGSYRVG